MLATTSSTFPSCASAASPSPPPAPRTRPWPTTLTLNPGGHGAGRDAIDFILGAQASLDRVIEEYLDVDNPAAAASDVGSGKM